MSHRTIENFLHKLFACKSNRSGTISTDLTPKQRGSRPQLSVLVKECTVNVQNEVVQMETQNLAGPFKRCPFTSTALCSPLCCHSLSMLAQPCHLTTRGKKMSFRMPKCFCFPSQSVNPQLWVNKYKSRK